MFLNLTPIFRDPREEGECNISVLFVLFTYSINLFISILRCGGTTVISDCVWEFHFPPHLNRGNFRAESAKCL